MNKNSLVLAHIENMAFETHINGFPLLLNGALDANNKPLGITPKKLLLAGLTGCTAMDVKALLDKMRVAFTDFSVAVDATLGTEHPVTYLTYQLVYKIKVKIEDREKVEKAVKLSKEKYCGVSAMLGKSGQINYTIEWL
jgi:putative redox protein